MLLVSIGNYLNVWKRIISRILGLMKDKKGNTKTQTKVSPNPFLKLLDDKKRIDEALRNGVPLSSLKDIKFVKPL